jgi:DNA-binding response OmpR family regulator
MARTSNRPDQALPIFPGQPDLVSLQIIYGDHSGMSAFQSPPRILIADDNLQGSELLEAFLADQPFETRLVHNGEQALLEAIRWMPDIILLDVMMPRISGFDACQKLRKDPATADIGIIMVTALDQPADIDRAVASGTDDMITKPVNRHDLIARVHGLLAAKASKNGTADRFLTYIDRVEQISK